MAGATIGTVIQTRAFRSQYRGIEKSQNGWPSTLSSCLAIPNKKSIMEINRFEESYDTVDGTPRSPTRAHGFDVEVEQLKKNTDFMAFLRQLSEEKPVISLHDLREELGV